jgi:hypothetical protein
MKDFLVTHNTTILKTLNVVVVVGGGGGGGGGEGEAAAAPAAELILVSVHKEEENFPRQEMLSDSRQDEVTLINKLETPDITQMSQSVIQMASIFVVGREHQITKL